jgi:hypothetical protein
MQMLQIVTVYQTSKGFFNNLTEASRNINRKKVDISDRWGPMGPSAYEPVEKVLALTDGINHFQLNQIEVK